ncbi:MAG: FmdB family zinc ribbon protein [Chloroflexota bacterium]
MPLYEYRCTQCGQVFDKLVSMSTSSSQVTCPACGQNQAERLVSRIAGMAGGCGDGGAPAASGGG